MKLSGKVGSYLIRIIALLFGGACMWLAVWLTSSVVLGVPLGILICMCILLLYMNAYDKIIIPIRRRRERRLRSSVSKCGRYGDKNCEL